MLNQSLSHGSGGLNRAIGWLLTAAKTGKRSHIVEATAAIERVLRDRRLL